MLTKMRSMWCDGGNGDACVKVLADLRAPGQALQLGAASVSF